MMEHMENPELVEQMESEAIQPSGSGFLSKEIDLSASASNHVPTSEFGSHNLAVQSVPEGSDFNNQSERVSNSEGHLRPDKPPSDEDAALINNLHSRQTALHSNGDIIAAPTYDVDYAYNGASFHAGQMDTTLPAYEPNQHTSPLMGPSEPVNLVTQQDEPDGAIPRIQAYAKLEFEDGEFYMNTYSVELGRDLGAARLATEWEQEESHGASLKRRRTSTSSGEASPISVHSVREDERHNAGRVISDAGGILGPDAQESHIHKKPRLSKSQSATPSPEPLSRRSSMDLQNAPQAGQSPVLASLIDASTLHQADPEACPLIRIHPPTTGQGIPASHKGISRRHVKIAFSFERHVFELTILGRNGAFVDEVWYKEGDTIALKNGSLIQIGGVRVRFLLPDMSSGEDGAEAANPFTSSSVDSAVNHGFSDVRDLELQLNKHGLTLEDSPYESSYACTSSEGIEAIGMEAEGIEAEGSDGEDDGDGTHIESPQAEDSSEAEDPRAKSSPKLTRAKQNGKAKMNGKQAKKGVAKSPSKIRPQPEAPSNPELAPELTAPVVKRKGPGRPPKNGIMSKREQKLLAKQAQEAAKATEPSPLGEKVAVTNQDDPLAPPVPAKRKYTKRKIKDPHPQPEHEPGGGNPEDARSLSPTRQASEAPKKAPKAKKPAKRQKSPSPEIDPATLTKEQLARPPLSYIQMIHEALRNHAPPRGMNLPEIYSAISRKYPYYRFVVTTVGWQSSVRHNLLQCVLFIKLEREGKGYRWGLNPNPPDKVKKRRASPPKAAQHASHHPQMTATSENHQQPHPMHAPHNAPQPSYPMHTHQDYPQASTMPSQHPSYPGVSIPNGHAPHNNAYTPPRPPGQIPYPQPGLSHQGGVGPPYQVVGPNGFSLPLLNGLADSSSTYQSPYQPVSPTRPPETSVQQPASTTLANGVDGARDPGTVEPPPPLAPPPSTASETLNRNNHLSGPGSSPVPQTQQSGPASTLASNPSQEILQAITQFKTSLVSSMKDHQYGEALVTSAINRVLGYQTSSSLPSNEEDPQEKTIMEIFSRMLDDLKKKSSKIQRQPPQPSSESNLQSNDVPLPPVTSSSPSAPPNQEPQQQPQQPHQSQPPQQPHQSHQPYYSYQPHQSQHPQQNPLGADQQSVSH